MKGEENKRGARAIAQRNLVEGIAHVVAVDPDGGVWLEPEQTTSCGHCASAATCGEKGIGTLAARLEARRFHLDDDGHALRLGDRVVVGIDDGALMKGALTAYALPLIVAFAAGAIAQWVADSDAMTMVTMATGLGSGLLVARILARRLASKGVLAPRFLRYAADGSKGFDATICETTRRGESPAPVGGPSATKAQYITGQPT